MRVKKWMIFVILPLFCTLGTTEVHAQDEAYTLPVITQWQDGYAYQEDGTQIFDTWAYDSVNPAGKYVLLGEDGIVLQKTENLAKTDLESDYTGTELVQATLVLRADVFEKFCGTVTVLLKEKSGLQKTVKLSEQNFFGLNVPINSGTYMLQSVEAKTEECSYTVEYPNEAFQIAEQEAYILNLRVTDSVLEVEDNNQEKMKPESEDQQTEPRKKEQQETEVGKEKEIMHDRGVKKILALVGSIGTACFAGIWLLKKRRKKHR